MLLPLPTLLSAPSSLCSFLCPISSLFKAKMLTIWTSQGKKKPSKAWHKIQCILILSPLFLLIQLIKFKLDQPRNALLTHLGALTFNPTADLSTNRKNITGSLWRVGNLYSHTSLCIISIKYNLMKCLCVLKCSYLRTLLTKHSLNFFPIHVWQRQILCSFYTVSVGVVNVLSTSI